MCFLPVYRSITSAVNDMTRWNIPLIHHQWNVLSISVSISEFTISVYVQFVWSSIKMNLTFFSIGNMLPCIFGFIMDQIEAQKGTYPVTLAYLQFMSVICSQISSINKEEFHCYLANMKCVFEHIFGSFLQWKFTNPSEKKRLGNIDQKTIL